MLPARFHAHPRGLVSVKPTAIRAVGIATPDNVRPYQDHSPIPAAHPELTEQSAGRTVFTLEGVVELYADAPNRGQKAINGGPARPIRSWSWDDFRRGLQTPAGRVVARRNCSRNPSR